MTSLCDHLVEALYQVFTTPLLFPPAGQERYYESLCRLGYAEIAAQGHASGYRITPDGHAVARARWGHDPC